MTIGKLTIIIAVLALLYTILIGPLLKRHKSIWITFLQAFTGILFVISGWVKAIDPMGTGFKMQQYFAEFEAVFENTWFSFINPLWPFLSEHAMGFSVFMIVLEIVLGLMLLLGDRPKLTSWLFFIIVIVFTVLTGFTFLTGFVPSGVSFFEFSQWGPYEASNMKVTDCGCFGDFMKLEPRTSFFKDIVLLVPATLFLFQHSKFHQLLNGTWRSLILGVSTIGLIVYCLSNYMWDLPNADLRPFREGVDIMATKQMENEAQKNRPVFYKLKNKSNGQVVVLPMDEFMANFANYPKEEWEYEQELGEASIHATKISDFSFHDEDGNEMTEELMMEPGYQLMIVSHKLKGKEDYQQITVKDTTYRMDTVTVEDSLIIEQHIEKIEDKSVYRVEYSWDPKFVAKYREVLAPFVTAAQADNIKVYALVGGAGKEKRASFAEEADIGYPLYEADDILLKTIIRSNPGMVLLKEGKVIKKWHVAKLPNYQVVKEKWIN